MDSLDSVQKISVIVPKSPFVPKALQDVKHCLAALDVLKLMEWWPGQPHTPHRDALKVRNIQRSLDWKRVAQIAAYLLQREITDAPRLLDKYFSPIYEPKQLEPGRQWPPKVSRIVGFERSEYGISSCIKSRGSKVFGSSVGVRPADIQRCTRKRHSVPQTSPSMGKHMAGMASTS